MCEDSTSFEFFKCSFIALSTLNWLLVAHRNFRVQNEAPSPTHENDVLAFPLGQDGLTP